MKPKAIKSQVPTEHQEQVDFVQTFRLKYPQHIIFAVPNGDHRAINVAKRLKDEGVLKGVPDLVVLIEGDILFIEMKRAKGGVVSKDQKEIHAKLNELGYKVVIAKGAKDAWNQLTEWLER